MTWIFQVRHMTVSSVSRYCILCQIVRPDTEKIHLSGELVSHHDRGRDFHHYSQLKVLGDWLACPCYIQFPLGNKGRLACLFLELGENFRAWVGNQLSLVSADEPQHPRFGLKNITSQSYKRKSERLRPDGCV